MKATEQYFPVVLFIKLFKVVWTFESECKILQSDHSNESYFTVVLISMLQQVVLTFQFEGEILKCDDSKASCGSVKVLLFQVVLIFKSIWNNKLWHLNTSSWAIFNGDNFYYPIFKATLIFLSVSVVIIQTKAIEQFLFFCAGMLSDGILNLDLRISYK